MAADPKYPSLISIVPLPEQAPELRSPASAPSLEETSPLPSPDAQTEVPQEAAMDAAVPAAELDLPETPAEADSAKTSDAAETPDIADTETDFTEAADTLETAVEEAPVPAPAVSKKPKNRACPERSVLTKNRLLFLLASTLVLLMALYSPTVFSTLHDNTVDILTQIGILAPRVDEPHHPTVLTDEIRSEQAILIDLETGLILAEKDAERPVAPASMTKIMTLMTAVEHIENLDDSFTMTQTILNTTYDNDLSIAGFVHGETVPIRDLLYGLILPSGADASFALTSYLAELDIPESEHSFSEFMNEKAAHYGLSSVHFMNSTGMFDEMHQASLHDVAVMLWFAMQNTTCREVLTTVNYTTTKTEQHPDGIKLTNHFLEKIAEKDCGAVSVIAAKTGFVDESGRCAASYAVDEAGHAYICVTVQTDTYEQVILDHAALYAKFIPALSE